MRKPPLGEYNLGSLAGAVVGSIGGLFAIGVVRAILGRNLALVFATPILGMLSWVVCGIAGWLVGGQIGPRLGETYYSQRVEILGGALGRADPGAAGCRVGLVYDLALNGGSKIITKQLV